MPELRLNLVTREWVIISTKRAIRPDDFRGSNNGLPLAEFVESCPFCPGNEEKTPPESLRINDDTRGGKNSWRVRVIPNKFSALTTEGEKERCHEGTRRRVSGVGRHEVIIETPFHNLNPATLDIPRLAELLRIYRERFLDAYNDHRVEHVIIFRNHGEQAGTSLEHPHSQLIATPVVPLQFRDRVQAAMHYFDDTGHCLLCEIVKAELKDKKRIILETEDFITFIPYAAVGPYQTWIFPKRHSATFASITDFESEALATHLKAILSKLYFGLGDPDYNYVIRTSRPKDLTNEYCHWYVSIHPRLSKAAGFELGTGMHINSSRPEVDAEFLRSVKI
ncbi:MAG: galactose-1-phosphate uridylyltransferase [Deltaproteobacteria bacterium]|nr:galactose-1-phosphate uridylyltransferase [Deltaproteobacteria bacterium]